MLKGIFIYKQEDYYGKTVGHIKIKVSETEKAYSFELLENTTRYDYDQFVLMFKKSNKRKSNKTRINKTNHGNTIHAIRVWSDNDFTIYPFQAGIPFWFTREKE